ncbi:MAG: phosphate ABC transporter ATP-binding protein, partial [Candidatus Cloacimonetes bacterium]|nr:phosphate ABC transporter ATP-binding protein [Candidatus Cloacimonadota bacterium]
LRCFNRMNDLIPETRITGKVMLYDENIYAPRTDITRIRTKVGMVFQKPNPFPKSVFKNVAYGLHLQGLRKNLVEEIVEKSLRNAWLWDEVKDRLHTSAFSLSGGQQQRLCIARALANDPEIILLDEPTSALDPQSTSRIEELCLELKNQVTILIVTHNIAQAGRISDQTAFMYLGEMIEFGETQKMFTVPKDKRTEAYLSGIFG